MEFHFGMQDGKGRQNTDSMVHTMCNCRITSFFYSCVEMETSNRGFFWFRVSLHSSTTV